MSHLAHSPPLAPDALLQRLLALYTWFLPSLDWRVRQRVESAGVSFRNEWGKLLPDERERAVDVLVARWCAFKADSGSLDEAQVRRSLISLSLSRSRARGVRLQS